MARLYKASFYCSLGVVGITVDSVDKLQKAFNWFSKNYPDAKILFCKEVYTNASYEKELH